MLCDVLKTPLAHHKTEGPTVSLEFYGIQIDTKQMTASLPQDKLVAYLEDINVVLDHKKIKLRNLQSIIGKLLFATAVVTVGRAFLRRLYDLTKKVSKPYYCIRLTHETKEDLRTWITFLQRYNGVTIIKEMPVTDSNRLHMYADASAYGYGCTFGQFWLQGRWPADWASLNIAVLELYPVLVLISTFAQYIQGQQVTFHSDNAAVVAVLSSKTSSCPHMMAILRPLVLTLLNYNISLASLHIPGQQNFLCDFLSRKQATPKLISDFGLFPYPTPVATELLPEAFKFN